MIESNPNIFINAFFLLIIVSISSFGFVIFRLRKDNIPAASFRYFFLYFAAGILAWATLWLKESSFTSLAYSAVVVLYVLSSMFLLLGVLNYVEKLRLPITIIAIHIVIILGSVFVDDIYHYAWVEGLYTLAVYLVIAVTALKRAFNTRDMGIGIIGVASILAFVVSPIQLYGAMSTGNAGLIYASSVIFQSVSFVLVGVGFLSLMLISEHNKLVNLALRDPLTGLYTRLGMVHAVEIPLAILRRSEGYIGAIAIEIDSFKEINSNYGKAACDSVLKEISEIFRMNTRNTDLITLLDNGKFVALLPGESVHTGLVAERLRDAIEKASFTFGKTVIKCTLSLGVASQSANKDFDYLLNISEAALQHAMLDGGNLVFQHVE